MTSDKQTQLNDLISTLVSYKTVDGNVRAQEDCLHFTAEYLAQVEGLHFSHYTHHDYHSMVITNADTKRPDILLSGHVDVVPGDDSLFEPYIEGGRMYGRGTMDMKAGVAAIVQLMHDISTHSDAPSMGMMLTTDEEKGGKHGAGHLVHDHGWRAGFILTPEGKDRMTLVSKEKGVCWVKVTAQGESAHGAYPWKGTNAVEVLMDAYQRIRHLFPDPADAWQPTISLSNVVSNSPTVNQTPQSAEAILDIRYTDNFARDVDEVLERIRAVASDVEIELLVNGPMLSTPDHEPQLQRLRRIASSHLGRDVRIGYNHGASDAAWFAPLEIPAMVSGIVGNGSHGPHEYVELQSVYDYYDITREFILGYSAAQREAVEQERIVAV